MSVPSWEKDLSKTQYIYELYLFNQKLGHIVIKKPVKYRYTYGDTVMKSGIDALRSAICANNIFMSETTSEEDYNLRRKYLQHALGLVDSIGTIADLFLSLNWQTDGCSQETLEKEREYIGAQAYKVHNLIKGVLESDKKIFAGEKETKTNVKKKSSAKTKKEEVETQKEESETQKKDTEAQKEEVEIQKEEPKTKKESTKTKKESTKTKKESTKTKKEKVKTKKEEE